MNAHEIVSTKIGFKFWFSILLLLIVEVGVVFDTEKQSSFDLKPELHKSAIRLSSQAVGDCCWLELLYSGVHRGSQINHAWFLPPSEKCPMMWHDIQVCHQLISRSNLLILDKMFLRHLRQIMKSLPKGLCKFSLMNPILRFCLISRMS